MTSESDPMTAAIFGLIGVIVGGLLNAAAVAWQARRGEKATARLASRLVALELQEAFFLLTLNPDVAAEPEGQEQLSSAAWASHRDALARTLDDEDWNAVAAAYEVIEGHPSRALAKATAPKADPRAPGSPTRSDLDIVGEAARRLQAVGEP